MEKLNLLKIGLTTLVVLFLYKKLNKKEDFKVIDMYVALVIHQRRTCNPENKKKIQVPARWRELVISDLEALGLDLDGQLKSNVIG